MEKLDRIAEEQSCAFCNDPIKADHYESHYGLKYCDNKCYNMFIAD